MTDRPIIFSAPMVRALLDGRKTQTRRLASSPLRRCEVGDRLYVRESYYDGRPYFTEYQATWPAEQMHPHEALARHGNCRWTPSIHMPRWASRLTLIVEGVKVEPLQAISEDAAKAEGAHVLGAAERHEQRGNRRWISGHCRDCAGWEPATMRKTAACPYRLGDERDQRGHYGAGCSTSFALRTMPEPARFQFENLWGSLHFNPGETWIENPDVVALTFRVIRGNIDQVSA